MKLSIITPTFKRPAGLKCAVDSVINQSFTDWEMLIINDNPGDGSTVEVAVLGDARISIIENEINEGVNFSRNRGLEAISPASEWVIFLDDDDQLAPDALVTIFSLIESTDASWIVTSRGLHSNSPTTVAVKNKNYYSYVWDYLITRKFQGDATHCIKASYINSRKHQLRFPNRIRQAEEWLFYAELGTHTHFYYESVVTTLTDGYGASGLNLRTRSMVSQLKLIPVIVREAKGRNLLYRPSFWIYIAMRIIRAFIK